MSTCNVHNTMHHGRKTMQLGSLRQRPSLIHLLKVIYLQARPIININQADTIHDRLYGCSLQKIELCASVAL